MNLQQAILQIKPPDKDAAAQAKRRWDSIAKPLNSLGLMEKAVIRIAGLTGSAQITLDKRCVVVMCADNGVVAEGVTQTGSDVTAIVTENFTKGETSVCTMARVARCDVIPVDLGVARDVSGTGLLKHKISRGTKNIAREPAMTKEQAIDAIEFGINLVAHLKADGYRMIATGEMGIGNTTTSSAVTSVLLNKAPEEVTGRGAGLSEEGLNRKIDAIERAIAVNHPDANDPIDVLSKVGGYDIAGLCGVFLGGAAFGVPVVIDGFISAVAALLAKRMCADSAACMLAAHRSKEPAGEMLLKALDLRPFITADMCLGEGTGAVAAIPLLDMACAVYNEMSTFSEIQIEDYQPLD
ncbi:nicotinate-nucleotide--dimethylbenzimidazole phosphoribosyltransferase [Oscillospiraceae bacterium PP1C4]